MIGKLPVNSIYEISFSFFAKEGGYKLYLQTKL